MAIYLGLKVLLPPYALVATAAGSLTLLGYILSRTSVLAIETEAGDRHIVAGSEGVLLRLCMMVDRVGRGITIEEARKGLEHIDAELPTFRSAEECYILLIDLLNHDKVNEDMLGSLENVKFQMNAKEGLLALRGAAVASSRSPLPCRPRRRPRPVS